MIYESKITCSKICVSGVPEEEEGMEIAFEEIMAEMSRFDENYKSQNQKPQIQ